MLDEKRLPPLGLFVAKYRIRDDNPALLDVTYYHDGQANSGDHEPRQLVLECDSAIRFPARLSLTASDQRTFTIDIVRNSATGLAITIYRSDKPVAKGLGVVDPDDGQAVIVSGWTGDTEPYGIAKYRIRDGRTVEGYYLSKMTPEQPGHDTAIGDTSGGFPGAYSLTTLEVSGRTWGPHDWRLSRRGDLIDLVWRDDGKVICRGFGLPDPLDPQAIIVNYIPVSE